MRRVERKPYSTRAAETTTNDEKKDTSLAPGLPSPLPSASRESVTPTKQLQNGQTTTESSNHWWRNDYLSRGRGKSWFSAWRAVKEEEAEDWKPVHQQKEDANGGVGVKDEIQQRAILMSTSRLRSSRSLEEQSTKAMRASPSFRRDLASLDAGLLHNPANGTIRIDKEVEAAPPTKENQQSDSQDASEAFTFVASDSNVTSEAQDLLRASKADTLDPEFAMEGGLETTLQKYRRKFQGLFFPPWRPYTSINLDLDPEGEYIDPDMGQYSPLSAEVAPDQEEQVSVVPQLRLENNTIHVLGLGPIGKYIAHTLASIPHGPPITLLMHRPLVMQRWHDEGAAIRLVRDGELHVQSQFNIESAAGFRRQYPDQVFPHFGENLQHSAEPPSTVIETLIVTTDAAITIPALETIKYRLRRRSTICFFQDGLGIAERVSAEVFPDADRRPTFVLGSISHKIAATERHFTIMQKSPGLLTCSKLPQYTVENTGDIKIIRSDFSWSPSSRHLIESLSRAPEFDTRALGHKNFYRHQLQKVVMGCIIGPLSVMYDCPNDQLLFNYNATVTMQELLKEISSVICSLPELKTLDGIYKNFNARKLEGICVSAIAKTGRGESSMLQAVRAGKRTNIEYYNGWIARRGAQLGIPCPRNEMVINLVKGKTTVKGKEISGSIPMIASF